MKKFYSTWFISMFLFAPLLNHAQLNNGGNNAGFGVDGDTRSYWSKYGPVTGAVSTDDWFSFNPAIKGIIDTSNAAYYKSILSLDQNLGFTKRMSAPLYSKINGKLWLDAVYGRDYVCTSPLIDSTVFTISAKNGDDPSVWLGGSSNIPDKTDLQDVYAHMRRDGTNVTDSLWFFTGVSTVGTSGSRYFDIELYKKDFSYDPETGVFTTAGSEAGHTEWPFDASGNITQTGDMIVAVNYAPGAPPVVDVRIWVSDVTFASVIPSRFNFGPVLDGAYPQYGYVSIKSKTGATAFGSGIANYSVTAAQDTTTATPWGTTQSTKNWGMQYQSLQLVEIGLNLSRIGVDPALYSPYLSPCESLFTSIFFKSRSSNSFTSNMQDFVGPLAFLMPPVLDYTLKPDTLRCNKSTGVITLTPQTTMGYYSWTTPNGTISGSNSDSSQINISSTGTYIVTAAPIKGCPATRKDTIVILKDTYRPVASAFTALGPSFSYVQFYGGNVAASNYPTPFGGSKGLLWDWSGPAGFTSTIQNPINDTVWGNYRLIVTEKRNGCKDTATIPVSYNVFALMAQNMVTLDGRYSGDDILLKWQGKDALQAESYTIEKSTNGKDFGSIAVMTNNGTDAYPEASMYHYVDNDPSAGNNFYRIKVISKTGVITYSNITLIGAKGINSQKIFLSTDAAGAKTILNIQSTSAQQGTVVFYGINGQLMGSRKIVVNPGLNQLPLEMDWDKTRAAKLVTVFLNNERVFTGKVLK